MFLYATRKVRSHCPQFKRLQYKPSRDRKTMKLKFILFYLLACSAIGAAGIIMVPLEIATEKFDPLRIPVTCCFTALIGSCLFCMRTIYLTQCAHEQVDEALRLWFYLRPIAGFICGGVSFVFLKWGLLILESNSAPNSSETGFYALSLIAGLNVDKFIIRIERVAHAIWGMNDDPPVNASNVEDSAPRAQSGLSNVRPLDNGVDKSLSSVIPEPLAQSYAGGDTHSEGTRLRGSIK